MKTLAKFVIGVVALSLVLVAGLIGAVKAFDLNPFGITTVDRSGPTLLERVRTMEEFRAAEASFIQDIDIENDTSFLPGFISGERYVVILQGTVQATVDFSGLSESALVVDEASSSVRVRLPLPVLQPAEVDEESMRVISHDRGLTNRIGDAFASSLQDQKKIFAEARKKIDDAAADSELAQRAAENTEQWFEMFLTAAGFTDVQVEWQG